MPSNWATIDQNFPTFTGEESAEQQIRALHNYLFQLREGLQYSLQNLTTENFNATALQKLTDDQKNEVTTQLQKVYTLMNQLSGQLDSLSGRVTGVENLSGRVTAVEKEIDYQEDQVAAMEEDITGLQKNVAEHDEELSGLKEWADQIEGQLTDLEEAANELADLQEDIFGEDGLSDRLGTVEQKVEKISGAVAVAENGAATVGSEGKVLNLVGQIYINGVLYGQGDTT